MLDHVNSGQIEKITKMCARGMDPNFHCPETGGKIILLSSKKIKKIFLTILEYFPLKIIKQSNFKLFK